jgi:hypothetical protein
MVEFALGDGKLVNAWCSFEVLRGLKEELILGIPDILTKFKALFLEMVASAGSDLSHVQKLDGEWEAVEPWSRQVELAEEEDMIPETSVFLGFLELPYEEAFQKYLEDLPSRISGFP